MYKALYVYIDCMYFGIIGEPVDVRVARPGRAVVCVLHFLSICVKDPLNENKTVQLKGVILLIKCVCVL